MKRKAISKKDRFEIFKRDRFTCQYCGDQPPNVVLVIDHINPVANGGDNDIMNLITSCSSCNQGKSDRELTNVPARPDADIEWLEIQQEIAELRRYQLAKEERDMLVKEIISSLQKTWYEQTGDKYVPDDTLFIGWMLFSTPEQIEESIKILGANCYRLSGTTQKIKYFAGVLRNITGTKRDQDA